jgi:hypothetical protein
MVGRLLDDMQNWAWTACAVKGTSHQKTGLRLQDAFSSFRIHTKESEFFCGIISDGAGSSKYGGEGASIVCRTLSTLIRSHFKNNYELPEALTCESWVDQIRDRIYLAASKRSLAPRDFAATLIAVISDGEKTLLLHIGDGCAVFQDCITSEWFTPSWPNNGEFASTTYFVTDEYITELRIIKLDRSINAITIFSDGLERLALNFKETIPFSDFFKTMTGPLFKSKENGKIYVLNEALKKFLDSESINLRTDDDKSLIIAVKK